MVLNAKFPKKSGTCLRDQKIYPIKLFFIVIIHQSFRIIKAASSTDCLTKTEQDQYLQLRTQSHISF